LFNIKTDDAGSPLIDLKTIQETSKMVEKALENKNVLALFLFDKICLVSTENYKDAIKSLESCISYVQEAIDKLRSIENRNF